MKGNLISLILAFLLTLQTSFYAGKSPELPSKYRKWLEEVAWIISPKEERIFKELETDKLRDLFMEEFWRQRDPTPGTSRNEFKEEHYRRIEYVNRFFGRGTSKPGWKTDRGRIYIILGEPISRETFHNDHYIYPTELWFYRGDVSKGLEPFFYIVFFKRFGSGDFVLYSPLSDKPNSLLPITSHEPSYKSFEDSQKRTGAATPATMGGAAYKIIEEKVSPALAEATLSLIPGGASSMESEKLLGNIESLPQRKVDDEYAYEFRKHEGVVEVSYSVQYIGNISLVKIFHDESGLFFVHYAIQPQNLSMGWYKDKYYSNIKISGRVTDSTEKTVYQFEREYPLELNKEQVMKVKQTPMAIQDSFPLIPGSYRFALLLQNTVSKEFTSFDKGIVIPEIGEFPRMSDLVLAFNGEKEKRTLKSPFKVSEMRLYPCLRKEFTPEDTLFLFFQLYGISEKLRGEGRIEYTFFKEGGEQCLKKRKGIKEYSSGEDFLEEFSLRYLIPSKYRIKVSVLNGEEREVLSAEDEFSVLLSIRARPWIHFKRYPASGSAIYSFITGVQSLNKGEREKAEEDLSKAYELMPENEDFALGYAQVLLNKENYEETIKVLIPFVEKTVANYNLFYIVGRAHQGLKDYERALFFYQRYISHQGANAMVLNSIGECFFNTGNYKEASRAWEKSLEINPGQPEIKKKIENIKGKKDKQ